MQRRKTSKLNSRIDLEFRISCFLGDETLFSRFSIKKLSLDFGNNFIN